jgi:hypothetical protein
MKLLPSKYNKDFRAFRVLVYVIFFGLCAFLAVATTWAVWQGAMGG